MKGLRIMNKNTPIQTIEFTEAFEIKVDRVVKKVYEKLKPEMRSVESLQSYQYGSGRPESQK